MMDEVILDWLILHCCHLLGNQDSIRGLGYPNLAIVLPSLSSQPPSRYRSTQGPRRWPVLLPVALGSGLVFPSHRSFHACCAYKSERATMRLLYTHREMQQRRLFFLFFYVSRGGMQDTLKLCCLWKTSQYLTPKTPALHWWDWWYLGWSGSCNIYLCSMDCHKSSMEVPVKTKYQCFFPPPWHIYGF